jgi:hypothetical protein
MLTIFWQIIYNVVPFYISDAVTGQKIQLPFISECFFPWQALKIISERNKVLSETPWIQVGKSVLVFVGLGQGQRKAFNDLRT